ncbi:type II toxin-antitoxin system VapC family toxin [soil metagenome]
MWYVDTSAFVKLVVDEVCSNEMVTWSRTQQDTGDGLWSSDLLRTEAVRAARSLGDDELARTRAVLDAFALVELSRDTFVRAGEIGPAIMRSLDAVHLAAALELGDDLDGVVSYDDRMSAAARSVGIPVASPGVHDAEQSTSEHRR